ncbi:gas vesicle protein GvpG [Desulfomonile tiedjei]|uniref:Gas vesicle protein G n=1 Tax=Desulfomonile tiedjei (strain ATCC 49306 / DSM 6799 / DCB-1) TaxID=706587 RepID=I4CDC3_DESTA|nr:gas vesicle protein GvpG [Desulfomonile tiedjei]AFM27564.1 Gas vesicle protein G [Desulfomonile tiedjei DSM 6799]
MFLLDDILFLPMNGVLWICNEIHDAAEQELHNESDAITAQLQKLYTLLEAGDIGESEFDVLEAELLDRLDAIQERGALLEA